ncbi:MAG: hypothetical protein PHO02_06675 [Candidatus Nanoarchaeia archaeon]|nr:hypothetical protein [Candidatus Nanoarchaeia archaeon]
MKKALPLLIVFLISVSMAYAANGCAEKTKSGEWCVYTSEDNVEEGAKFTPTICEQTSYCKIGCCYSSDEGRCFKNTPRAACTAEGATWNQDAMCSIDQCAKGCCVLGDQAFFVTEVKCKQTASMYPEVAMVYNNEVKSEAECVASAKSQELGCCVTQDSCSFTARASCDVSAEPIAAGSNETKRASAGFYKDMLCSNDQLNCGCAKQKTTGCIGEDVYWFDSCGNRENIYNADKRASYNEGYILKEEASCTASAGDTNCGNCDYASGTVCGADTEKKMEVGNYICIGLGCKTTYKDDVSPNANGNAKKNGESWCVFDSMPGLARDLVGSRHYRHICINGEEMVEDCKDFREEVCVQGVVGEEVLRNVPAMQGLFTDGKYIESACRDNRHENCYACNSYLSDEAEKTGLTATILEKRKACCEDETLRDCYWLPTAIDPKELSSEAREAMTGTCVPQVPPGLKFWGDESQAAQTTQATTAAEGSSSSSPSTPAQQKCAQASSECTVKWTRSGLERAGAFGKFLKAAFVWKYEGGEGWHAVVNPQCTNKEWVIAGNNICKAVGDCGAYYNIRGRITKDGYLNTLIDETGFGINGRKFKLTDADIGNWEELTVRMNNEETDFWSMETGQGGDIMLSAGLTMLGSGLLASGMAGWTWGSFGMGVSPFSGIGSLFTEEAGVFFAQEVPLAGGITADVGSSLTREAYIQQMTERAGEAAAGTGEAAAQTAEDFGAQYDEMVEKGLIEDGKVTQQTTGIGTIMTVVQTYMWLRTVMQLIDTFATENIDRTYTITCQPWQAPVGGSECETCNEPMKPCSEYKCKSLGSSCALINQGTSDEKCVAMDVNDVNSPIIKPMKSVLTPPYTLEEVTEAGNPGYRIKEKIKPFTSVIVGISTNEPATCKYNVEPGTKFENMPQTFGSSLLLYNQTVSFTLPSELAQQNATKVNKGEYAMYVRCKDANGNENEKDYFIKFTIDDSPDLTPPSIRFTSLQNDGYVAAATTEIDFSIYVDEYAECRYSRRDTEYEQMEHSLACSNSMFGQSSIYSSTYECKTRLTNLTRTANMFFIRCSDQPGRANSTRNTMSESYQFKMTGSDPLNITSISPSGDLYTKDVTLKVQTIKGADAGKANCGFSNQDLPFGNMIGFSATGTDKHEQAFMEMDKGDYTYYVSCVDKAGNEARKSTSFKVTVDSVSPMLTSVYIDSAFGLLHLEFDEECTCEYSSETSSFAFGEGTPMGNANERIHETQTSGNVYYVKCKDRFDNKGEYRIFKETASSVEDFFF